MIPGGTIMLYRAALILRDKQPFVDWINAAGPSPTSHTLTRPRPTKSTPCTWSRSKMRASSPGGLPVITRSLRGRAEGTRTRRCGRRTGHPQAQGVVFVRAPHHRGGNRFVSARRRRVGRMNELRRTTRNPANTVSTPHRSHERAAEPRSGVSVPFRARFGRQNLPSRYASAKSQARSSPGTNRRMSSLPADVRTYTSPFSCPM